ncbi:hypothetical protein NXW76_26395 [Bacteroides thetaiotaomicron]|nr:hypothetical protein [Bacteroides thetaiotaomicron]
MWLDDLGNFWEYKLKVNVNYAARTFSTTGFVDNVTYESKVKITDGKVLEKLPQLLVHACRQYRIYGTIRRR